MKVFMYRGKTLGELQALDVREFAKLVPARRRRSLLRGHTDAQKALLARVRKVKDSKYSKPIKTHCRDMIVLPEMVDHHFAIHRGKEWVPVKILPEMIGRYLGEMSLTRKRIAHSAPGVGATKSSSALSVK